MRPKIQSRVLVCGLLVGALPGLAAAQTEPLVPLPQPPVVPQAPVSPGEPTIEGQTVAGRQRPELDALGVQLNNFFFYPRAEIDEAYNDNIRATASHATGDFITTLAPSFDLLSNFATSAINLHGGAALGEYASHSERNFQDAYGATDGHVDIDASNQLYGGLRVQQLHEDQTSPDFPGNAREPVIYHQYAANLGNRQSGAILGYQADTSILRQEFSATPATGGGLIFQSDRDVTVYDGALEGNYEMVPGNQLYLRGEGNYRGYDHAAGDGIPIRTSEGVRVDAGIRVDLTGLVFLTGYVGYLQQNYQAAPLSTIRGPDFGGHVIWNPTTLTSVTLNVERSVLDADSEVGVASGASLAFSPGYLHTVVGLNVDHELLRSLLLNANVSYYNDSFKGINRTDQNYLAGVGAKYLLNRNLYLGFTYSFWNRSSSGNQATNPFTQSIFLLRLSTQL